MSQTESSEAEPEIEPEIEPEPEPKVEVDVDVEVEAELAIPEDLSASEAPRRRRWIGRGILAVIILCQAILSLHDQNTAYQDEGLYIVAGHLELDHFFHAVPENVGFNGYLSGVPAIYPVLAALADSVGGLAAARLISLLAIAGAIALLYASTRYLFNERVACCAAGLFAVTEPAVFLANFANFDATVLLLLALALWTVVRTSRRAGPAYLLAAPVLALTVAVKYFAMLFIPSVGLIAGLLAVGHLGRRAAWRAITVPALAGALILGAFSLGGTRFLHQALFNATSRVSGGASADRILQLAAQWAGWVALVAAFGAVCYTVRRQGGDPAHDHWGGGPYPARHLRFCVALVMAGSVLIAPLAQIHLGSDEGLQRHVGYGLLFAAPMAGVGLVQVVGEHFRRVQLGIAVWIIALVFGAQQAATNTASWPNSTNLTAALSGYAQPGDHVYVDINTAEIYYLKDWDTFDDWSSGYSFSYTPHGGKTLYGYPAYRKAVQDGYFNIIAYNRYPEAAVASADDAVAAAAKSNPQYRLVAVIPLDDRLGIYYIWLKQNPGD
jgi:hypothetical protein